MEAELRKNGTANPGLTSYPQTDDRTEKQIFTLNSAIMAVGEGNYGRLGPSEQRRFIDANTDLQLPEPDEQPGAMPEIAPSPLYGRSIDRSLLGRAQVLQAWGNYGTVWPVVHQWLGVRPDIGRRQLTVVPQVPSNVPRITSENILVGDGSIAVSAKSSKKLYQTMMEPDLSLAELTIGHVVPDDSEIQWVTLNGERVEYEAKETNRGQEILVEGEPDDEQTLKIKIR